MAGGRIKGITVEINGDTTGLTKALQSVNKEIKNTQSQLKDVNKLLKLDPGNTELLSQKQRLLGDAIGETKTKLDTLKTASEQATDALARGDMSQEQYDALQREIIETEQELKNLEQEYKNFGSIQAQEVAAAGEKMQELGGKMSKVGGDLTKTVTLPLAAVGAAGVKSFAEVDKTMQLTNQTMGNTEQQAQLLNKAMKEAAANSTFGMNDAATATLNFARAGLDAEQAAAALAPAMNLAAGEGGNLDTVSAGLVATINGFHGSFDESAHYADVFAAACNNSALDIDSLSHAMSVAAPIFSAAGYAVDDAALYMGVMANNGIDADKAANSLKTGLARLVSPAKEGAEMMDQLGISVTNTDGSMKNSVQIQKELHEAFSKLSESEQIAAASAIFGKNQMAPWLALINTAPSDVDELSQSLENCAGTTDEMAKAMMSGFGGSLEKLKSSLDVLVTSIGEALAPTIQHVADVIQKLVDKFNALSPAQQQIIVKIGLIVAAIGPLLLITGKLLTAVGTVMTWAPKIVSTVSTIASWGPKITSAIGAVKGALSSLWAVLAANPIILIIAAIAALVAAFIYLWNHSEAFRNFWINLWESIKNVVTTVVQAIGEFLSAAWEAISTTAQTVWNGIKEFFSGIWEGIKSIVTTVTEAISTAITSAWNAIYEFFEPLLSALQYLFETIWQAIQILIGMALDAISTKIQEVWNGIVAFLTPILEGIRDFFQTIWTAIKTAITTALQAIQNVVQSVWNAIKSFLSSIMSAISSAISSAWNTIKSNVTSVMNTIKSSAVSIWNNMKSAISGVIGQIVSVIQSGFNQAVSFIKGLIGQAYSWGRDLIMGIVNGIRSAIGAVADAARSVADSIRSFLHFSVPDVGPLTDYETYDLGSNPFLQTAAEGTVEDMVLNILSALQEIRYVPFTATMIGNPIYDLMDVFCFRDGLADGDKISCMTKYSFVYNSKYTAQGVGQNPALASANSKSDKNISGLMQQVKSITNSINKLIYDYNTGAIFIRQREQTLGMITYYISQDADVEGHFLMHYVASESTQLILRFYDQAVEELYSPVEIDISEGEGEVSIPHAYLQRSVGIHAVFVTAQCMSGELSVPTRGVFFTIDAGNFAEAVDDISMDVRDITMRQLLESNGPDQIWIVGLEDGKMLVSRRAYSESYNSNPEWEGVYTPGKAKDAAIEFDGKWVLRANSYKYTLETEDQPWYFWVDEEDNLIAQHGEDELSRLTLDTGVSQVNACKGYSSILYPEQDQGLVVAYIKGGRPYYRQYVYDVTLGDNTISIMMMTGSQVAATESTARAVTY